MRQRWPCRLIVKPDQKARQRNNKLSFIEKREREPKKKKTANPNLCLSLWRIVRGRKFFIIVIFFSVTSHER